MTIKGVYVPILTPFKENGSINESALEQHVEFLISKGIHGLFPLGTTGEGMLLSREERKQVADQVVKFTNGRIPVVIHVGDQTTEGTIELAKHAEQIGADGISVICPYFFPVDDEAIYQHYSRVSKAVSDDFSVFAYNFPGNARNEISLPVLLKLIENHPNIHALKFSSDNFTQILKIIDAVPEKFPVMLGPDHLFLAGLHAGAAGGVSGNANVYPEPYVKLYQSFTEGNYEEAKKMQKLIWQVSDAMKNGLSMSHFKHALAFRGLQDSIVRGPLRNITEEEKNTMFKQLEQFQF
ncbi:dihydrodipicolinate synthase family protein [Paenibacillus eucommiae]|uniref:4-hydroxy-tetrahydrodipicolinate synthase n=1 Tax=Paenibacillus eucommiae TaxID=1355755 RepID=A0ABS4J711_9BACL|nr:dihydrodipicolinate synthase family protein [Paenibacillus eucommiae]MBP1995630.1 4-hydroxy-tetrahydrodipicolinate synthase [Paenibacillus eucommiae]